MSILDFFRKKPEPTPDISWGAFLPYEICDECGQAGKPNMVIHNGICPHCGSQEVKPVIGRWSYSLSSRCLIEYFEFQERKEPTNEPN